MQQKTFFAITGIIFFLIFFLHLLRIVNSWEAVIGGWVVPMWFSWISLVVAAILAFSAYRLKKGS